MKALSYFLAAISIVFFVSCGGEKKEGDTKDKSGDTKEVAKCNEANVVESILVDSANVSFEPKVVFANLVKGVSYRVIFINYEMSEYGDYKDLTEGQIKMVIGLFNPEGDEFQPGVYTYSGNENGKNKVAFTLTMGEKNIYHNTAGLEDSGKVEITHIDGNKMCGTAHLIGQGGNEIKVSFSADNTKL